MTGLLQGLRSGGPCPYCGGVHEKSRDLLQALDKVERSLKEKADPQERAEALEALREMRGRLVLVNLDLCPAARKALGLEIPDEP